MKDRSANPPSWRARPDRPPTEIALAAASDPEGAATSRTPGARKPRSLECPDAEKGPDVVCEDRHSLRGVSSASAQSRRCFISPEQGSLEAKLGLVGRSGAPFMLASPECGAVLRQAGAIPAGRYGLRRKGRLTSRVLAPIASSHAAPGDPRSQVREKPRCQKSDGIGSRPTRYWKLPTGYSAATASAPPCERSPGRPRWRMRYCTDASPLATISSFDFSATKRQTVPRRILSGARSAPSLRIQN